MLFEFCKKGIVNNTYIIKQRERERERERESLYCIRVIVKQKQIIIPFIYTVFVALAWSLFEFFKYFTQV